MGECIARAGVMTLLSDYEAHPVAVMEALTAGRPAVISRTSGLTELADLGWAVGVDQHASAEETARAIERQLDDPLLPDAGGPARHGRRVWLVWSILMPSDRGSLSPTSRRRQAWPPQSTHALPCPRTAAPSARPLEAVATLMSCVGLLIQVIGYAWGWHGDEATAIGLWYVGFVGIVVPFTWLLLAPSRTGHQRLGAALAFGLIMYASWFLTNPVMSTRFDETLHVTTLVDMVDQHSFFIPNSTLPVSPHYPGLEFATAGVHWLTGLPLIVCQVLVVVTARSTFILALFLLASRIGRSTQVGAATVLLYAGSAQFYFFNAQFSYQTVAIAMLMAALYLLVRAFDSEEERPWRLLIAVQVCLGGLAITHHLTSWLMLVLLWLLALFFWRGGEERRARLTLITRRARHAWWSWRGPRSSRRC